MAEDVEKFPIRRMILGEIEKFADPGKGQRLALIAKTLAISKQNLNRYLKQFQHTGLIQRTQEQPYAIYQLTPKGRGVNDFLVQSEKGNKIVMWRYHNLIMGYTIREWGTWKFRKDDLVPMNNWNYQIAIAENGAQAHVQDTALLKIYGPEIYGPDGEEGRITSVTKVSEAARWFIDKYGFVLGAPKICRKGEKELQNSEQLAKLLGRVKTDDFYVNASYGKECLEEKEDSYMLEGITEMPRRLDSIEHQITEFKQLLQGFLQNQLGTSNAVMYIGAAMKNQTEILGRIAEHQTTVLPGGERVSSVNFEPLEAKLDGFMDAIKVLVDSSIIKTTKNAWALDRFLDEPETEVEILQDVPRFLEPFRGAVRALGPFRPGSRIYLNDDVARLMIKKGLARGIREDTARTG